MTLLDKDQVMALETSGNWNPWNWDQFGITHLKKSTTRNTVFDSGNILGYLCGSLIPPEAEIQNLCVDPARRRLNIAGRLLEEFIHACQTHKVSEIFLEVREKNEPAKNLYRKFHFDLMDIRKNYYSNPTDHGLRYSLKLN